MFTTPGATMARLARSLLLVGMIAASQGACSSSGTGKARGTGGSANTGGTGPSMSGGSGATGGMTGLGGAAASGGIVASGGTPGAGGMGPTGGAVGSGGTLATGGTSAAGGVSSSGGAKATGGTVGTGGGAATGGTVGGGGANATGGTATGGTVGGGGASATGGAAADRCDVGVYDSANPPKVLTLSGNLGAHDPSAIESNGTYYEFHTGLGAKTSTNLTTWNAASVPFGTPAWMTAAVSGVTDLWAPDISFFGGSYHLYYAGSTFGSNKSCIGHATRASLGSGAWTDQGSATICSNVTTTGDNWNAIDPNAVVDTDGNPWLVFGSFWGGIKIIPLDQTGARVGTTVTGIAARPSNGGALEGPFMIRRCGYYYLFTSWDTCCKGAASTYNIRVVRGTSVTGPFADKAGTAAMQGGGTLIAQTGGDWAGPGGQSVMFTGQKAYLVYHAYAMSNGSATLRIADLVWDSSGWPVPVGP
jgi:arabinan endo-1,5-alpha-L-arabinosidase